MELLFSNKMTRIKVIFHDNMVKLEARYYLDKMPKDAARHPIKYRRLKSGKVSAYAELFIPNRFIFDALSINDKEVKKHLGIWFENLVETFREKPVTEKPVTESVN